MAIRFLSFLCAIFLTGLSLQAQGLGSMRDILEKRAAKPDTAYAHALIQISEAIAERMPDSASAWAGQALALSRRANDKLGEAYGYYVLALTQASGRKPDMAAAETTLRLARTDFEQLGHKAGMLKCLLLQIRILQHRSQYLEALTSLDRADSLAHDSATTSLRPVALWSRADLYSELGLGATKGLPLYRQSVAVAQATHPKGWNLPQAQLRLANYYRETGQADSSAHYFDQAADHFEDLEAWQERMHALSAAVFTHLAAKDTVAASRQATNAMRTFPRDSSSQARVDVLNAESAVQLAYGKTDSAVGMLRRAITIIRPQNAPDLLNFTRLQLGKAYLVRFEVDPALRLGDSALVLAESLNDPGLIIAAADFVSKLYTSIGDARNGLRYAQRATAATDSLRRRSEQRMAIAMEVTQSYEEIKRQREAAAQAQSNSGSLIISPEQKYILMGAAGLLVLLILLLWVGRFRKNRQIRELKAELLAAEKETDDAYEELARFQANSARTNTNLEQLVDERTEALKSAVTGLIEANEELDTFIYRASHDLLGPLARLKGLVNLAKTAEQQAQMSKAVDLIAAVTIYMDRVLRKLILVRDVKFPGGGAHPIDIVELITKIEPSLSELPGITQPGIEIEDWIQGPVKVDERNLRIVLENLLENACIFRKDVQKGNPLIKIQLKKEGKSVQVEIFDSGIGIPDGIRERVFEIFFRGSERSKGNGLGLFLVRRAVDGLNGSIEVESKEGAFTKIVVRFPEAV